jgi:molybdopterin molybdotransferase
MQSGAILEDLGHIPDSLNSFKDKVGNALNQCDYLIISGGSSVGTRDLTLKAFQSFNPCEILFHGIAAAPGKPTLAAVIGPSTLVLGLPGHPASAYIVFIAFIRPLLQGHKEIEWSPSVMAILDRDISSARGGRNMSAYFLKK